MQDFLCVYRATPHSATEVAPADLMFRHSRACGLPRVEPSERHSFNIKRFGEYIYRCVKRYIFLYRKVWFSGPECISKFKLVHPGLMFLEFLWYWFFRISSWYWVFVNFLSFTLFLSIFAFVSEKIFFFSKKKKYYIGVVSKSSNNYYSLLL